MSLHAARVKAIWNAMDVDDQWALLFGFERDAATETQLEHLEGQQLCTRELVFTPDREEVEVRYSLTPLGLDVRRHGEKELADFEASGAADG